MLTKGKVNILMVDDRPENLIALAAILDDGGYNLVRAESGHEALRFILNEDFALILLDVQMPVMDGFETAALIKKRERSRHIPIIFITANHMDERFIFKGYGSGAVDYILKPVDPHILRSKVAVFAELHRKTRQLVAQVELQRKNEALERDRELARLEMRNMRRHQLVNEKYRELVEGIRQGIVWTMDPLTLGYTFVSAQAGEISGFAPATWVETQEFLEHQTPEEDRARVLGLLREVADGGDPVRFEHRLIRSDGNEVWFQTGARLSEAGDEQARNELRGLSVDITELKLAEKRACAAVHVRDEFLSIASHELKTPLTSLKLQFQLLERQLRKNTFGDGVSESLERVVTISERQVERLNCLVDQLLDVSKINNGKLSLEPECFSLGEITRDVLNRFGPALQQARCEVQLSLNSEARGNWDRSRVEQIVTNLLTNAAKYGAGAPIEIEVVEENGSGVLRVKDHGIGIAPEDQKRIFIQFERAASAMNFSGLGLGLYIVHQIVEAHGGRISVESRLGEGSTFTVHLPQNTQPGLETAAQRGGEGSEASASEPRGKAIHADG